MTWVTLSVVASFLWAVSNVLDKYILVKLVRKAILPTIALAVIGVLASVVVTVTQGIEFLSAGHVALGLLGGISYALMALCYYRALQSDDVSKVIPLFYFSPLFIAVAAALLLGEVFGPFKYLGVLLLVAGAVFISWDSRSGAKVGKAFWFMLLAAACSAFTQILTKYLLGYADFWTIFTYIRIGALLPILPFLILYWRDFVDLYRNSGSAPFTLLTVSEILNNVAILMFTLAVASGFVTLVNALTSIQPFFVLVISIALSLWFPGIYKEEIRASDIAMKAAAIGVMFIGAILVS